MRLVWSSADVAHPPEGLLQYDVFSDTFLLTTVVRGVFSFLSAHNITMDITHVRTDLPHSIDMSASDSHVCVCYTANE